MRTPTGTRILSAAVAAPLLLAIPAATASSAATASAAAVTSTSAAGTAAPSASRAAGWGGVVREPVSIDLGQGWKSKGELTYPRGAKGRLPVVVLLHGSGPNDMDQTLPGGKGSTFVPIAQAAAKEGYAVLRFHKRGVVGVGPVLTKDATQLAPADPYSRILQDAAAVVRFAAASSRVDPSRIFLLGHSEGTQVASNLAATPAAYGIPKPAGVIEMGVVGIEVKQLLIFQVAGVKTARLHEESDIDGDGTLTHREAADGLLGQPKDTAAGYRKVLLKGSKVNPATDRNADGRLSIDSEVGPVFRRQAGVRAYPALTGVDPATQAYLTDIGKFPTASQDLPRFSGPVLLLNGQDDIQTPARAAIVADAALTRAGHRDHELITYPGMSHTMNRTAKFEPEYGPLDGDVLADIRRWLRQH